MTRIPTQQTIVITGAGRGIGKAMALRLASLGQRLVLAARTQADVETVAATCRERGAEVLAVVCDVASQDDVARLADETRKAFGVVTVLINNAGIGYFESIADMTIESWQRTVDVNLTGPFLVTKVLLPLYPLDGGLIINVASIAAKSSFPNFSSYTATKAGLAGFSNSLREELRPRKIRVTVLYPGATDSSIWDNISGDWDRTKMMSCEDIAEVTATIIAQPPGVATEEVVMMPSGGAL